MLCALHGFGPRLSLWRGSYCRHGLHISNGTAGRLAMKSNNTYHVEVRRLFAARCCRHAITAFGPPQPWGKVGLGSCIKSFPAVI